MVFSCKMMIFWMMGLVLTEVTGPKPVAQES